MKEKILYLHVGAPKTGSTAIQNFLTKNTEILSRLGYAYETSGDAGAVGEINSGNGEALFQLINEGQTQAVVECYLTTLFHKSNRIILSSELFALLSAESLSRLRVALSNIAVRVKVILFLRDVQPLAISDYDQRIKRHGEYRTFSEYLRDYSWPHYDVAISFHKIFGDCVVARSYDSISQNLIGEFLNLLEIDGAHECFHGSSARDFDGLNRGLTSEERAWLLRINGAFGMRYSESLSRMILQAKKSKRQINAGRNELIDEFVSDEFWEIKAEEISKLYNLREASIKVTRDLGGGVAIHDSGVCDYHYGDRAGLSLEAAILLWAIDRLKEAFDESVDFMVEKISASIDNSIPRDFNPIFYLLKNKDILLSDHDPTLHYLKFGRQEGREFSIKGRI